MRAFLLIAFTLIFDITFAQKPLTNSRQNGYYTYLYPIGDKDLLELYKGAQTPDDRMLHHPVDSFKTGRYWENHLPAGNYIKVHAEKNELKYELVENHTAFLQVLSNHNDLRFILQDKQGAIITNAEVIAGGHNLSYDAAEHVYHIKRPKKEGLIEVKYSGITNFFKIEEDDNYRYLYHTPALTLKQRWYRIKNFFKHKPYAQKRYYEGFMAFNKPQYKPGDTVKLKAFILHANNKKPISQQKLVVRISKGGYGTKKMLGDVSSYRDGGFEYSFVLNDTLKLTLDEYYTISLENPAVLTYKPAEHTDDANRKFNAAQVYIYGSFKYEEYELKSTQFSMRTDKNEHHPGEPLAVYLKATDENNLPVPDGRVTLLLQTRYSSSYKGGYSFIPDELWKHQVTLDPVGETKVLIPDSIFPKAHINYEINAQFLNASNESRSAQKLLSYSDENDYLKTDLIKDTLIAKAYHKGKEIKVPATLSALSADDDTLSTVKIMLPAHLKINSNVAKYAIETDSAYDDVAFNKTEPEITLSGYRKADSVFVKVNNPRRLHFWYTMYAGKNIIDAGEADSLNYAKPYRGSGNLTFVINFIWGGESTTVKSDLVYQSQLLSIKVNQPLSVYPGQQIKTEIEVRDATGNPVSNTDVTAWAITRKFSSYRVPVIPYLGKSYYASEFKTPFVLADNESGNMQLNWNRWSREMGLDSIAYYRFTHPQNIYCIEEPAPDSVTQVAPFLVYQGNIVPVHILYIDERPVYFSQAEQLQRYSFGVKPGKHHIRFRTLNQSVYLKDVEVAAGHKLILSINMDSLVNKVPVFTKMPETLTPYEAGLLNRYMIRVDDTFGWRMATLQQNDQVFLLNPEPRSSNYYNRSNRRLLVGPLADNYAEFHLQGDNPVSFLTEPNYTYLFEPGLLKQTSLPGKYAFNDNLNQSKGATDYKQYVLTRKEAGVLWQEYLDKRSQQEQLFPNDYAVGGSQGHLTFDIVTDKNQPKPFIKNVIVYSYTQPDFIRIFTGSTSRINSLDSGRYRLFFLLKGDEYAVQENVNIKPHGNNHYTFRLQPRVKDSVSIKIAAVISQRSGSYSRTDTDIQNDALKLKEAFNEKYIDTHLFGSNIQGQVMAADDKLPVPGATIKVKGTSQGVVTDRNGRFSLSVPKTGKLIISYIGYETQEVAIHPGQTITITLKAMQNMLQEVVVAGYSTQYKRSATGSASTMLQGRAAGVAVMYEGEPGDAQQVFIRGNNSMASVAPLYVVDGQIASSMAGIDPEQIGEISVLKAETAMALYGARAANGVVIINTKKGGAAKDAFGAESAAQGTIRKKFADYAYWQPHLTTNAQGKASFTTIFPDDITNWRTFVVAINGEQQSGFAENQIKSFKPLSAALVTPQFAVRGDELTAIGKVMNYSAEPVKLTRSFSYNGAPVKQGELQITNSKIDTLNVTADGKDSLSFEYTIKRSTGYFDGELRKIPLIEQGITETRGSFAALDKDTTVTLKFNPALGQVTFRAEASLLPVLTQETERLRNYSYLCNEQLASKLKGLLLQKQIKAYLNEPFEWDKNINNLIKKLNESSRTSGLWGWWKDSNEELWISLHVVEALLAAQKQGYKVVLNKQKLQDYLVYQVESYQYADKIKALQILKALDAQIDYEKYITAIRQESSQEDEVKWSMPRYDRYRLLLLRQQAGLPVNLDTLLRSRRYTMFGNQYWGESNYQFFDNSVQLSLLVYQLLKNEGKHPDVLLRIRGYLLEQRHDNQWRNTYESALILEALLPDLLSSGQQIKPAQLVLTGGSTQTVNQFPYTATLNGGAVTVAKTGSLPVYITTYQQFWNRKPEKVSKDFTVNTWFEKQHTPVAQLKGGEAVHYQVEVTARADADFVMIEVPVPAGCSYESKEQQWEGNEVHREYFKEKVSIFCRKLKQGKYTYTINLMPRYSGTYTVNPAKAELMYFPVFYGREGMKKVKVQ